jgi:hypothetical protein
MEVGVSPGRSPHGTVMFFRCTYGRRETPIKEAILPWNPWLLTYQYMKSTKLRDNQRRHVTGSTATGYEREAVAIECLRTCGIEYDTKGEFASWL